MNLSRKTLRILKGELPIPPHFYLLAPFAALYSLATRVRRAIYNYGWIKVLTLPRPVISVGNITAGGTGKTPFVIYLAEMLASAGTRPAVITRGYRGLSEGETRVVFDGKDMLLPADEAGDEAVLLAGSLPGVPVVMGCDRYAAGLLAIEKFSPDVLILDDGFQHVRLYRDIDILLMDALRPFGNGFTIPLGYLREPKPEARRADLIVLTRADRPGADEGIEAVKQAFPAIPPLRAVHAPVAFYSLGKSDMMPLSSISGKKVFAASGLADPASFTLILQNLNAKITGTMEYPDHHRFTQRDLTEIEASAAKSGAESVVITEKDAVKFLKLKSSADNILVLKVKTELPDGDSVLKNLIYKRISGK